MNKGKRGRSPDLSTCRRGILTPVAANTAIDWGVLWDGNCLYTVLMTRLHAYVSATITKNRLIRLEQPRYRLQTPKYHFQPLYVARLKLGWSTLCLVISDLDLRRIIRKRFLWVNEEWEKGKQIYELSLDFRAATMGTVSIAPSACRVVTIQQPTFGKACTIQY
jgi:hypothetical protein